MKDDHMKNAQLKPGYNIQLGVEGEYITGLDISSERSKRKKFKNICIYGRTYLMTREKTNTPVRVEESCRRYIPESARANPGLRGKPPGTKVRVVKAVC